MGKQLGVSDETMEQAEARYKQKLAEQDAMHAARTNAVIEENWERETKKAKRDERRYNRSGFASGLAGGFGLTAASMMAGELGFSEEKPAEAAPREPKVLPVYSYDEGAFIDGPAEKVTRALREEPDAPEQEHEESAQAGAPEPGPGAGAVGVAAGASQGNGSTEAAPTKPPVATPQTTVAQRAMMEEASVRTSGRALPRGPGELEQMSEATTTPMGRPLPDTTAIDEKARKATLEQSLAR